MPEPWEEEARLLRASIDLAPEIILFIERASLSILDANAAACRVLGYRREELVGMDLARVVPQTPPEELAAALDAVIQGQPGSETFRTCHRTCDGQGIPVTWRLRAVDTRRGPVVVVLAVPEGQAGESSLLCAGACRGGTRTDEDQCLLRGYDALTGLPDRRRFERRLGASLAAAAENPQHIFAVLFIDLDGFKAINDTFGHLAGDRLLREIVGRLVRCVRTGDLVARYGGDEFVVLLDDLHGEEDAVRVAQRIAAILETPASLEGSDVKITASIGIALSRRGYRTAEEILHDADRAMYDAKAIGKARYAVFRG